MYGIKFYNHPDMRRILSDYGSVGNPLLKNYPVSGFTELRYDVNNKRITSYPSEFAQRFRSFVRSF